MASVSDYTKLITSEHNDKPKFVRVVEITVQPYVDLINLYESIPSIYDLDNAVGAQLDVVGQWVGISRNLRVPLTGVYFTFNTGPGFNKGILKGKYDQTTGLTALTDPYYKLLIRAKILNNHWDGSRVSAQEIGNMIFSTFGYTFFIQDFGNLTMNIGIVGPGTPVPIIQQMLITHTLDIKPATVKLANYVWQSGPGKMFMFNAPIGSANFSGFNSGRFAKITPN